MHATTTVASEPWRTGRTVRADTTQEDPLAVGEVLLAGRPWLVWLVAAELLLVDQCCDGTPSRRRAVTEVPTEMGSPNGMTRHGSGTTSSYWGSCGQRSPLGGSQKIPADD